jgi:hypothetical protein
LVDAIGKGTFRIDTLTVPLADVESIWDFPQAPGLRTVFVPRPTGASS